MKEVTVLVGDLVLVGDVVLDVVETQPLGTQVSIMSKASLMMPFPPTSVHLQPNLPFQRHTTIWAMR